MRKIFLCSLVVSFFLAINVANAETAKFGENYIQNLTASQLAELQAKAAKMVEDNKVAKVEVPTVEKVSEYAKLGQSIGSGLVATAKELGVAANDFLKTPVGMIAMALIVYKIVGSSIIHLFVGMLFLVTSYTAWIYFFRRICLIKGITYESKEGVAKPIKKVQYYDSTVKNETLCGYRWTFTLALIPITFVGIVILFG